MFFTEKALARPNRCAIVPFIGQSHEKGFVDLGILTSVDPNVYLSVEGLQEVAKRIPQAGLCPRSELILAQAKIADLERKNEDLRTQMAEYDRELDAITVLKARGYKPTQKPGRKPAAAPK